MLAKLEDCVISSESLSYQNSASAEKRKEREEIHNIIPRFGLVGVYGSQGGYSGTMT
jgi:hypothetical protein